MDSQIAGPSSFAKMDQNTPGRLFSSDVSRIALKSNITDPPKESGKENLDFSLLCRICGCPNDYLIPIFEGEGLENTLADKIESHLPIKVKGLSKVPQQVCYQCASTLLAWHDLVECCLEADSRLHARITSSVPLTPLTTPVPQGNAGSFILPEASPSSRGRSTHCRLSFKAFHQAQSAFRNPNVLEDSAHRPHDQNVKPEEGFTLKLEMPDIADDNDRDELLEFTSNKTRSSKTKYKEESKHPPANLPALRKSLPDGFFETLQSALVNFKLHYEVHHCGKSHPPNEENELGCTQVKEDSSDFGTDNLELDDRELNDQELEDQKTEDQKPENIFWDSPTQRSQFEDLYVKDRRKRFCSEETIQALDKAKTVINDCIFYICPDCGKNLRSIHTFIFHMRIHSGEKPCVCHLCGKQFRINAGLQRHVKETHHKVKNQACETCGRKFANRQNLAQHQRIHTGERPYVCSQCGKRFKQSASLYLHNKTHTDLYPFPCTTCDAKFRSRSQLTHHVYKHTGEKPNVCDICSRAFRVKHELNTHRLTHTDERPFICTECGLSFKQRRYLRNHNKKSHNIVN